MSTILIVYGTRQGHTAEIAQRMAGVMQAMGADVEVRNLRHRRSAPTASEYDAVVVGGSVHAGGYEHEVRRWVRHNLSALTRRPNAFVSVALSSVNTDAKHTAQIDAVVNDFVLQTGWQPRHVEKVAGALPYSKYNPLVRWLMKRIVRKEENGAYTDTSRDYDFTDYDRVDEFAKEFVQLASAAGSRT